MADLPTGTTVPLQRGPAAVKVLIFTPDGEQAVAASTDGLLGRWRTDDGQPIRRHQVGEPIYGLAVSPDQRLVSVVTANNRLLLWDLPGDRLAEVPTDRVRGDTLSFTADSKSLAYRAWDGTIRLVDTATHRSRILRGHRTRISRLVRTLQGPSTWPAATPTASSGCGICTAAPPPCCTPTPAPSRTWPSPPTGARWPAAARTPLIRVWRLDQLPTSHATDRDAAWLQAHTSAVMDLFTRTDPVKPGRPTSPAA